MDKQVVFITGASQGLGRQMAIEFARRGYDLAISSRRPEVLAALKSEIQQRDAVRIDIYPMDATVVEQVQSQITQAFNDFGRLDIVIANAGLAHDHRIGAGDFSKVQQTIDLNITGAFATIEAAMATFKQQGFGQIVGLGSVAGTRGMPRASSYCASKAALATYMEALRLENPHKNIIVTLLKPGYIDTPMNQALEYRPFVISVEKGGQLLVDKIEQKVASAYVPALPWALLAPLIKILPNAIMLKLFR